MLIGLDPRVTPELLHCLALMGHGDEIVIADRNYPADATARHCQVRQVIRYPGHDATTVADLIAGLMPLDSFHAYSALRMEIDDAPDEISAAHKEVFDVLTPHLPEGGVLSSIERQAFYAHARTAFGVVQCSEDRPFGCFILRKGVIF